MSDQEPPVEPDDDFWNVSHVVPRSGPQFPLTPAGQLARLLKQEWLDIQHDKKIVYLTNKIDELLSRLPAVTNTEPELKARDRWYPARPEWATYTGFRADMLAREQRQLKFSDTVTKIQLADSAGCHPRTITRTMDHYGLRARQWPPSTWPEQEPLRQLVLSPHVPASLAASVSFALGLLDAFDGQLDGVFNAISWLSCHVRV